MKKSRLVFVVLAAVLVLSACTGNKSVGSKGLTDFEEQKDNRLGGAPSPTAASAPPAQASPLPGKPVPTESKPAQQSFTDITLIAPHPYFEPGDDITVTRGHTVRVTNKDNTAERPTRTFAAEDGSFDSGPIKPGGSWTRTFNTPGSWRIVDPAAPFISAKLTVR